MTSLVTIDGQTFKKIGRRIYWKGSGNPNWKGGITIRKNGRVMVHSPNHPRPSHGKYVYRSHLVVEAAIGRYLEANEVVHHKNRIVDDDRIENLEVMDVNDHNRLHANDLKTSGRWAWKYDKCVECGTTEQSHKGHGLCTRCSDRKRWPSRRKNELAKTS